MYIYIYILIYMAVILFEGSVIEPRRTFVTDLVTDLCNKTRWLHTSDEQTAWLVACPSLHTLLQTQPQPGPATCLFAAAWLQSSWSCGGALCILRFALPRYRSRYIAVTHLDADPTPARASNPPFLPQRGLRGIAAINLELRRRALQTSLCFASLQTSLHSRYIPGYRPNPRPGQ